jgi:L-amino acid N-acyltransferase YncA
MIREAKLCDAAALTDIYNYYILNTIVTFEEQSITALDMSNRITEVTDAELPWLVAEQNHEIVAFAYASKWKGRFAYRYSAEVTIYLSHSMTSKGVGSALYSELFLRLRGSSIHVVLGGISLPNDASIALHEKFGMSKAAHFDEVGFKFGNWVDVAYWQGKL